ncbi:6,7-dimethyl-8-ribityllumazine synthase [Chlamydia muridarum str. Nigg]|uniref:6,7-dimethyl-8-ribityllumazine synthase n=2 Tax=Chlamydia muridarum TaxID=83560 RepID=RISB_CHLMU|nr:6,7-dimethyl-8-ribityllumazine synthase [Chlamydia muridarum]Q9PLJ4.1 RecName: Full=6,7-dimethyl-8-ribityllumazine synthase; Short=DMRL synthase; Short=LS; Short=Lumazine synthase [Chlamydia muridarum str. Nigg]AAF38985.1 riboflavin synthase, beta subunit [Chlamydia muridarum str. Nigg]AHH22504.1 6,7-dimethyl-8-ribityllumazine synthase [Chlamydia muridarum str. Nigg3 CMUT3-5]AHH23428.1 6,7-dimethyl-8-ribityllumazine synthase [Chlamydia muridarum str. Nigg CM972]AID37655.1 6,7-dimethyl-8-rib
MKLLKGLPVAKDVRVAIVGACFNAPIADRLVSGARETFFESGGSPDSLTVVRVPGAFEIPCAIKKMLSKGNLFQAIVACGVLIQGETSHYEHIADNVAAGIARLSVEFCLPITFSVITAPNVEAAWERAGIKGPNLGASGMRTALEMASLFSLIEKE